MTRLRSLAAPMALALALLAGVHLLSATITARLSEARGQSLTEARKQEVLDRAAAPWYELLKYPKDRPAIARCGEGRGFEEPEPDWKGAIRTKLEQKVSFEFMDTPLDQAVTFFREVSGVNIVLDPLVVGATPPRVTLNMKAVPLRLALEWILKLANLGYELKDNAVFISAHR